MKSVDFVKSLSTHTLRRLLEHSIYLVKPSLNQGNRMLRKDVIQNGEMLEALFPNLQ